MPKNNLTKEEKVAFDNLSNCKTPTSKEFSLLLKAYNENRVDFDKLTRYIARSSKELTAETHSLFDPKKKKPHRRGTISN